MTQGELLVIPLSSNQGYTNQCHVVVHFNGADPDLGRKGFQPELRELAESISVAIVNRFKQWRKRLKTDKGTTPDIQQEVELHEWKKTTEKHEEENPLAISNPNFFAPIYEISISAKPQSEQDVIVLFSQLIAGGVIRGINLLATNQVKQYDGLFRFVMKEPQENFFYEKEKNPLGVIDSNNQLFRSQPKILEYKYNLDALFQEFESEVKSDREVDLAVAWELGNYWKKNYEVTSLLNLENLHQRQFHGVTHVFSSGTSKFYAICLRELIDFLNDVEGSQEYQKSIYSDDLF
jgi:hypothetical protein